jgi:hypothetical protein
MARERQFHDSAYTPCINSARKSIEHEEALVVLVMDDWSSLARERVLDLLSANRMLVLNFPQMRVTPFSLSVCYCLGSSKLRGRSSRVSWLERRQRARQCFSRRIGRKSQLHIPFGAVSPDPGLFPIRHKLRAQWQAKKNNDSPILGFRNVRRKLSSKDHLTKKPAIAIWTTGE